ncbi:hypothetical protein HMI54_001916 [Coelomomyces lativittatus]|nr:hypothetical protein HMI54_001916 [Coelomomyces lativittatus]KAJ1513528.1 hypothetical protein HMI55_005468 [Coelomomyces lativittatus]KAJ1514407.1 hypothetical protein HMI56_000517 [Coelomomyces lativittatus]
MTADELSLNLETLVDDLLALKQLNPMSTTFPSLENLPIQLSYLRQSHREAYFNAQSIQQQNLTHREAAMHARIAKLNRDWYKSHLEADITSYERADLDFHPDDLITVQELQQILTPQELTSLSPKEIMIKRFQHEQLARLRAYGQVTQKQNAKKSLQSEMLSALALEDNMECSIFHAIQELEEVAKSHGIILDPPQEVTN